MESPPAGSPAPSNAPDRPSDAPDGPRNPPDGPPKWLDYLRLFRAPNVFTAMADVTMGFLVVHRSLDPLPVFLCLLAASSLLYLAGMVLNDVFDVEQDREERPERPLPSGRISLSLARKLGFGMLVGGTLLGVLAGWIPGEENVLSWRSATITGLLAACILGYDAFLKKTLLGPVLMGGCRFFNVLLGMSVAAGWEGGWQYGSFAPQEVLVAGGIGLYVVGITVFARNEAGESRPFDLVPGALLMLAGIAMLGLLHRVLPPERLTLRGEAAWWLLLGLLGFTILRRLSMAIADPSPRQVQWAVKHGILSLIMLDAAIALNVSQWYYGLGIAALLLPTFVLGYWVYST